MLIFLIAVSLSMDAFSLSLAFGTLKMSISNMIKLSLIVGLFHFFMPLLGKNFGMFIVSKLPFDINFITSLILIFIGFQMIVSNFKKESSNFDFSFYSMIMFAFAVSLDSFSIGIGFNTLTNSCILSAFLFCFVAIIFTYLGLYIGDSINHKIGKFSTVIGGICLIIIGIIVYL